MAQGDLTLNVGHLTGLGGFTAEANTTVPQSRPGVYSFLIDALGFRIFKYARCIAAGTKGLLMQATGDTTTPVFALDNQTGAFTTKAVTSGLTVNDHQGKIAWVNDGTSGAAPEGEMTVVASNSATVVQFEPELPLSAALAANNDLQLIATYQAEVGTVGALAAYCQGVVVANGGITAGNYGWLQKEGICVASVSTGTALALGKMLIPGSTGILIEAATVGVAQQEDWVGISYGVTATDQAANKGIVKLKIFTCAGTGTTP